jgi:hypothetical protein
MNKMDFYLSDDPREKALRDALYRCIARLPRRRASRSADMQLEAHQTTSSKRDLAVTAVN